MAEINKAIENMRKLADSDADSKEFYRSLLKQIVVPDYKLLEIYLYKIPFGFRVEYTTYFAPRKGIYDIHIDSCEVIP